MLYEVLRNQAEKKEQNKVRYLAGPSSCAQFNYDSEVRVRFPIHTMKDFLKFNDDLRDRIYANQVVSA